jgi:hypothetical protein
LFLGFILNEVVIACIAVDSVSPHVSPALLHHIKLHRVCSRLCRPTHSSYIIIFCSLEVTLVVLILHPIIAMRSHTSLRLFERYDLVVAVLLSQCPLVPVLLIVILSILVLLQVRLVVGQIGRGVAVAESIDCLLSSLVAVVVAYLVCVILKLLLQLVYVFLWVCLFVVVVLSREQQGHVLVLLCAIALCVEQLVLLDQQLVFLQ